MLYLFEGPATSSIWRNMPIKKYKRHANNSWTSKLLIRWKLVGLNKLKSKLCGIFTHSSLWIAAFVETETGRQNIQELLLNQTHILACKFQMSEYKKIKIKIKMYRPWAKMPCWIRHSLKNITHDASLREVIGWNFVAFHLNTVDFNRICSWLCCVGSFHLHLILWVNKTANRQAI